MRYGENSKDLMNRKVRKKAYQREEAEILVARQ